MIIIDTDRCVGCLKCIDVCPFKVLSEKDGKPEVKEGKYCIKCLHCAAVCQQNAIKLDEADGILPDKMPEFPEDLSELIEGYLMTRRSYRHFKPEPLPKEILNRALRVSAWAPSAKNQHPARWIVVSDENTIRRIMEHILVYVKETGVSAEIMTLYEQGKNIVMGNAKTLILAYARTEAVNPSVDCALALYNTELILQAQGIGTCWAGYLTRMCNQIQPVRELLDLPEGCMIYGALMAGYPENEEYIHIPNRHKLPEIKWR